MRASSGYNCERSLSCSLTLALAHDGERALLPLGQHARLRAQQLHAAPLRLARRRRGRGRGRGNEGGGVGA